MNNMAVAGNRALFTVSQWQELEHQALIFKYLMAGIPVPPDLLLPIRKSLDSSTAPRFFHHPTMVWGSYYGKKTDPEPGRCRRTDGKKWRCSKDAYPDSKYCERHMHRGRNRSRKPVETHPISQSSSTVTSLTPTGSSSSNSFQNLPLHTITNPQGLCPGSSNASQMPMEPASYGMTNKDYRYTHGGLKGEVDEHSFFSEASGSARGLGMDSSLDSTWRLMLRAQGSSYMAPKHRNGSLLQSNYSPLQGLQDLGHTTLNSALPKQQHQHQHCFLGGEFGSGEPVKQEGQALRPFFDEWPKTRDSWSDLEEERSNRTSFSTTQLSISMPVASSDFSATSSQSPNDD